MTRAHGKVLSCPYESSMIQLLRLILGLAGQVHAQLAESISSTLERITEEWASQPRSLGSWLKASSAVGLVVAQMDKAMRISSMCSRGLRLPRWVVFSFWMGSMMRAGSRWIFLWMPARAFRALSSAAEEGPPAAPWSCR